MICLTLPCVLLFNCLRTTQSVQNKSYSCDDVSNLQEDFDRLHSWSVSVKWSLFFNDSKCVSMSFFFSKPSINSSCHQEHIKCSCYHIAGNSIEQLNFHRDLRIIFWKGSSLRLKISAKAYQKLGLPQTLFQLKNNSTSLVRSQLSYGESTNMATNAQGIHKYQQACTGTF